MNKEETVKLLSLVTTAYPTVELTNERIALWSEMLRGVPLAAALPALREHILSSHFPPTIADIIRSGGDESGEDREIEARNILIEHQRWVDAGNEPEDFVYEPTRSIAIR
ncbi:replicative helicase loader/inhibitor [Paenibacillus sp. GCM10012303]|uniref:replicative helicase loader/inhibitor n=1 Tax=Paenibacillus sp. GCM10012303 TaxID=3317340 RepID=UPI0036200C91